MFWKDDGQIAGNRKYEMCFWKYDGPIDRPHKRFVPVAFQYFIRLIIIDTLFIICLIRTHTLYDTDMRKGTDTVHGNVDGL